MVIIRNHEILMTRGDTLKVNVSIKQGNGVGDYIPLSTDVITFGVKKSVNDTEFIIRKNIPYDTMLLYIAPEDTKNLEYGSYVYDMQIEFANGDVYTFIPESKFVITGEVV